MRQIYASLIGVSVGLLLAPLLVWALNKGTIPLRDWLTMLYHIKWYRSFNVMLIVEIFACLVCLLILD